MTIPSAWYNLQADLDFELPPDLPPPPRPGQADGGLDPQIPLSLIRQELSRRRWIPIPDEVASRYARWRPTPLRRATALERELGTGARIFYKYEGANLSGSHKLNTAMAQAHYYKAAGATRLAVATGAGQWGTAMAVACREFGLQCHAFMVRNSFLAKPYRRTMMELFGASVVASPSQQTEIGRRYAADGPPSGSLSVALAEALELARTPGTRFCVGSAESYSILHNTLIGLEASQQLDCRPDVVVASLGAGSNFGGTAFPFLGEARRDGAPGPRFVAVEPAACPKLTRGHYRYDFTDSSELTPMQRVYTLGHHFAAPELHAGGLRYHTTGKIISALYDRGLIEAVAYQQRDTFASAALFARCEGIVPAPESAHAVHGAIAEAAAADREGRRPTILFCLSGHGHFDLAAYQAYLDGELAEITITDEDIERSLARLPEVHPA